MYFDSRSFLSFTPFVHVPGDGNCGMSFIARVDLGGRCGIGVNTWLGGAIEERKDGAPLTWKSGSLDLEENTEGGLKGALELRRVLWRLCSLSITLRFRGCR